MSVYGCPFTVTLHESFFDVNFKAPFALYFTVAFITVLPFLIPLTTPLALTVATFLSLDTHLVFFTLATFFLTTFKATVLPITTETELLFSFTVVFAAASATGHAMLPCTAISGNTIQAARNFLKYLSIKSFPPI